MLETPQPAHKAIPAFHMLGFRPWAPAFRLLALVFLEGEDAGLVEASNTSSFLLTAMAWVEREERKVGGGSVGDESRCGHYGLSKQHPRPQRTLTSTMAVRNLTDCLPTGVDETMP